MFFRQTKATRTHPQQTCTTRSVKGSPSSRRKITTDQRESTQGMKSTGYSNYTPSDISHPDAVSSEDKRNLSDAQFLHL